MTRWCILEAAIAANDCTFLRCGVGVPQADRHAAAALIRIVDNPDERAADRIRAAEAIIAQARRSSRSKTIGAYRGALDTKKGRPMCKKSTQLTENNVEDLGHCPPTVQTPSIWIRSTGAAFREPGSELGLIDVVDLGLQQLV